MFVHICVHVLELLFQIFFFNDDSIIGKEKFEF